MTSCERRERLVAVARAWEGLAPGERERLARAALATPYPALALAARCPPPLGLLWYAFGLALGLRDDDDDGWERPRARPRPRRRPRGWAAGCRLAYGRTGGRRSGGPAVRRWSVRLPGKVPRGERHR